VPIVILLNEGDVGAGRGVGRVSCEKEVASLVKARKSARGELPSSKELEQSGLFGRVSDPRRP
jgi:hypothetical protein